MATLNVPRRSGIYYIALNTELNSHVRGSGYRVPQWLPQLSLSSISKLQETASRTTLSQTFVNPSNAAPIADAKYAFPLYESCAVVSFRCQVGAHVIKGIIKEKESANIQYNEAVGHFEPAALLERHAPDIFSTSLGNIPPGGTVKVEIEYIMDLKHDAEVDGLRFTIPTSIAPRYGGPLQGMAPPDYASGALANGITITVEVTMSGHITSVQSPSHPISVRLGGHAIDVPDDAFNPRYALVTLGQTSAELASDFVVLIKSANLNAPNALLETHPNIPNSKALMVTLVPKFLLPEGPKPEIVFIADLSGSMHGRVAPLKSSLSVFLRSLPVGVRFNICSFGTNHSFLWETSQPYSATTLEEAQLHVDCFDSNFGGTEILPPVRSTIERRLRDMPLEIMVLTDGQISNMARLFEFVERETARGDVRVFTLGIGRDASHALIDGLARVGRGFSQVILDEREGMERKVARMLRGGLSAHVCNYRLEWDGRPNEEPARETLRPASTAFGAMSLFDTSVDTEESPISFSPLPDPVVPSVLQAPYKLVPLFPSSRTTAYVIFSDDARTPSQICLRGTTPSGNELELHIDVQSLASPGETIHQLAARKILQDLEEGTGYLHSGNYGVSRESHPGTFDDWVKREGIRVGLKYGLASEWTSFLAVIQNERPASEAESMTSADDDYDFVEAEDSINDGDSISMGRSGRTSTGPDASPLHPRNTGGYMPVIMRAIPPPLPAIDYPTKKSSSLYSSSAKSKMGTNIDHDIGSLYSSPPSMLDMGPPSTEKSGQKKLPRFSSLLLSSQKSTTEVKPSNSYNVLPPLSPEESRPHRKGASFESGYSKPQASPLPKGYKSYSSQGSAEPASPGSYQKRKVEPSAASSVAISYSPASAPPSARLSTSDTAAQPLSQQTRALIKLQMYEGHFLLTTELAELVGVPVEDLHEMLEQFLPSDRGLSEESVARLWATVLAVKLFEGTMAGEKSVWGLVVEKAKAWMRGLPHVNEEDIQALEMMAETMLSE